MNMTKRTDMERVGLFQEMSYVTVGDPYRPKEGEQKAKKAVKQLLAGSNKTKGADQSGYFAPKFLRLFEGDGYKTLAEIYRERDREAAKARLEGPFTSSNAEKMECGKGSFCATINPGPTAMSPLTRPSKKEQFKFAFLTGSPKKGTGYGYLDVTINPYVSWRNPKELNSSDVRKDEAKTLAKKMLAGPFHTAFPSDRLFDPNFFRGYQVKPQRVKNLQKGIKLASHPTRFKIRARAGHDHGHKLGTFHKFPAFQPDPYSDPVGFRQENKDVRSKIKLPYVPPAGAKSRPTFSTIQINLNRRVNVDNFRCLDSAVGFCC